jgi:WD40 repeat protein
VGVFDVQAGKSVCSFEDTGGVVCFSPNGRLLATAGKVMRLWDTQTWKELVTFGEDWQPAGSVQERRLAFSPDGKSLVCQGPKPEVLAFWSVDKLLPASAPAQGK